MDKIKTLPNLIINCIADSLGTKTCVLVFGTISLIPLASQPNIDFAALCAYLSQSTIPLITLPILAIVGKNEGLKQAKLLQETHDVSMDSHEELHAKLDSIMVELGLVDDELGVVNKK